MFFRYSDIIGVVWSDGNKIHENRKIYASRTSGWVKVLVTLKLIDSTDVVENLIRTH